MQKPIHPHAIQQMQSDKSLIAYHTLKIEKFKLSELLESAKARPAMVPSIIFLFLLISFNFFFQASSLLTQVKICISLHRRLVHLKIPSMT
jgi:hypothetical protein